MPPVMPMNAPMLRRALRSACWTALRTANSNRSRFMRLRHNMSSSHRLDADDQLQPRDRRQASGVLEGQFDLDNPAAAGRHRVGWRAAEIHDDASNVLDGCRPGS